MYRQSHEDASDLAFATLRATVLALDRGTGQRRWSQTIGETGPLRVVATLAQVFALNSGEGRLLCVAAASGKPLWRAACRPPVTSMLLDAGRLLVGGAGAVHCFDCQDGRLLWSHGLGAGPIGLTVAGAGVG
jgi:outer membrane protein assembly factor BamB